MFHRLRRVLGAGLAASLLAGLAVTGSATAATPITFWATYGDECVTVNGPAGGTGTLWLLSSGGAVLTTMPLKLDVNGSQLRCTGVELFAGMRLKATVDGVTRTWALPRLSVRVDRATDVVSGIAPAGKVVKIQVVHRPSLTGSVTRNTTRTATSAGTWSKDLTSLVNVTGGDSINVETDSSAGDRMRDSTFASVIQVWVGRSQFMGMLARGTGGTVTLRTASGAFRASGAVAWVPSDVFGHVDPAVFLNNGSPRTVRSGDRISSAIQSDMAFTVPTLTLGANAATNTLTGACPAGKPMLVLVSHDGAQKLSQALTCTAGGTFLVDTTATYDIVAGDWAELVVRLSTGDRVARRAVAQ